MPRPKVPHCSDCRHLIVYSMGSKYEEWHCALKRWGFDIIPHDRRRISPPWCPRRFGRDS